jgi:nucleoside-diphosphate-sugar epimerase
MKYLVTGAGGFIGSHLCERLLRQGHAVVGVDAFVPLYDRRIKEQNLALLSERPGFAFHAVDLRTTSIDPLLDGVDVVYHLAAMAGLTRSWSEFDLYESCNLSATQRLVQAAVRQRGLKRFVHASTSSVYGRFASGDETLPTRPISPYGVTKLAAENLCRAYCEEFGLPLVVLRYFSVYGPRQRPDMGYHKFIQALLTGKPITVCGDGLQVRGNTYIDDCIDATLAAAAAMVGETFNVGGGEAASVWDIVHKLEAITGVKATIQREPPRPGDQRHTFADTSKLARHLGWRQQVRLEEGLARQVAWQSRELTALPAETFETVKHLAVHPMEFSTLSEANRESQP